MLDKWKSNILILLLLISWTSSRVQAAVPKVNSMTPRCGSLNGGTKVTISGTNFARNFFNFGEGNEKLGSTVKLTSIGSHDCDIQPDGSHETQIVCYTRPMPYGVYDVKISVDDMPVPNDQYCNKDDDCKFTVASKCTPTITKIHPLSGMPGDFLEIFGNIITTKYGSNEPDEFQSIIKRVYYGGQKCELRNLENDTMFGIYVSNGNGWMKCKTEGTFIGNIEINIMISNEYGRSQPSPMTKHVRRKKPSMYQAFTEISISPNNGSTAGGTRLTITGQHFDETYYKARVFVGGEECEIVDPITDTTIVCITPADASVGVTDFTGGRGLYAYQEFGILNPDAVDFGTAYIEHVDSSSWEDSFAGQIAQRIVGYFVPPHSGDYSFEVKEDDADIYLSDGIDPLNKVQVTDSSPSIPLLGDNPYYIEIRHGRGTTKKHVSVAAHSAQTDLSELDTGMAEHEIQDLKFTSTTTNEVYHIDVTTTGDASDARSDEQQINITGDPFLYFQIGLDGIYSVPLQLIDLLSGSDVESKLKELPNIDFNISVSLQRELSTFILDITSTSSQGEISNYEIMGHTSLIISHERKVTGLPNLKTFTVTMDGKPTTIKVGASESEMKSALENLFKVPCNSQLSKGKTFGFETDADWIDGRVSYTEPFCGSFSVKNPTFIYHKGHGDDDVGLLVSSTKNRIMCFAYKGFAEVDYVKVRYEYTDVANEVKTGNIYFDVNNDDPWRWRYWCEDIYVRISAAISGGTFIIIEYAQAFREDGSKDLFIDQVMFSKETPIAANLMDLIYNMRGVQVQPNDYFIDTISVKENSPMQYEIELSPHHCGHNLPTFKVAAATTVSGSIYTISNGGSVSVNITKTGTSSPPIAGYFKVKFNGGSTPSIPVTVEIDDDNIIANLFTMNVGFSEVTGSGTCSAFTYRVKMVSTTGDQPLMEIDGSELTGTNVVATVEHVHDGGLRFNPIMGDLLRSHHKKPQVIVFINDIPTRCSTPTACTFEWNPEFTPTVSSITPTSGSHGESVIINGTGFDDSDPNNNEVIIGITPCTVTDVTTTTINCTINNGPTGEADIYVNVSGKGLAETSVKFTYVTGVNSYSSSPGSVAGGTLLTIDGFGFTSDADVTLNSRQCSIINITESQIICKTPQAASESTQATVDVVISQPGSTTVAGTFTYEPSLTYTPVVTAISPTDSNVWGGETVTIDGEGFGNVEMPVTLGGIQLTVSFYNDTLILATLPGLPHGSYKIFVDVQNKGYADLRKNNIPGITYTFLVTSMTPAFGSMYGGTDLLISGEGFSTNKSIIEVTIGRHPCEIHSVSSSEIRCRIADTSAHHIVSATGTHKNYGIGYAWDKDPLIVNVGDYVTWTWNTPFYVSDIAYGVHQTGNASDTWNLEGGFGSGPKSRSGSYKYRFPKAGTYFYWTGYMDSLNIIYYRGTAHVFPLNSSSETLSVQMYGSEATYDTGSTAVNDTTNCPTASSALTDCIDSTNLSSDATKFNFQFQKCYSPFFDGISQNLGTTNDVITITGDGFGDTPCQTEVLYDESPCDIVESSSTSVNFQISHTDSHPVGVLHEFRMRVANLGYALTTITNQQELYFGLLPWVQSLSPSEGSKMGGTKITITGTGFVGDASNIYVVTDYLFCTVVSANYTEIIFETHCELHPDGCHVGLMQVSVSVGSITAECDSNCNFTTSEQKTANVTNVSPSSVSEASTIITVTGNRFGTLADDLMVEIGGEECVVSGSVTNTNFTCTVGRLPVGDNDVNVYVANYGRAATTETVESIKSASISSPSESGTNGGAVLTLIGNGFVDRYTTVTVGGKDCPVNSTSFEQVTCTLPEQTEDSYPVIVISNGIQYDSVYLNYSTAATPDVTIITPSGGQSGDNVTIAGSGFKPLSSDPIVTIGGVECSVISANDTSITCTVGTQQTGKYNVQVFVPERGNSNTNVEFTYEIGPFIINPSTGSNNGGQHITLDGSGFWEEHTEATICDNVCIEVSVSASKYVCITPSASDPSNSVTCDVVVTVDGVTETNDDAYTYDPTLVSTINGVSPARGGTGGGTLITITGTNFGTNLTDISVRIADVDCIVQTVDDTEITCHTGAARSIDSMVFVQRSGWGDAIQNNAEFQYLDVWSSPYTWGGKSPPTTGDFVVIPAGQTILLDSNTDVLKMLLIQGGRVIFDEEDIELKAENILITDGGLLQIGTDEKPFNPNKTAIITMYGHHRSVELPIYGTKTLAVRNGTLNLYGAPVNVAWTLLNATAAAGANTLELMHPVDWKVGDEIVLATTGDRHSQKESEVLTISSVSPDGYTLTLNSSLEYEHIGISATFGNTTVDFRAEVGLLTRNVVVQGDRNTEFDSQIEACPEGFNTGEFATQTCFQGRFGEELGSDQFGAQVMVHQPEKDTQIAQAHLQNAEFRHSGQAFRLGRYPVHFHLNGNMNESFVRSCTIHNTFNRAVNIHGSHNVMVENNVIYDVLGGALFLEDGVERGNTFQYNLAIFVRASTSLLNDDITPAALWVTNPDNIIRHNAVAGGTHFGAWYRMHVHPDGPSFNTSTCPQVIPLGEYYNNTAHSLGWFGLWIFERYDPRTGGGCQAAGHEVAVFDSLTAWNCEKGAEGVETAAVQFRNFKLVNNEKAGYEGKQIISNPPQHNLDTGPAIADSVIVAYYSPLRGLATAAGIRIPYQPGFLIHNIDFYNFDQARSAALRWTRINGICNIYCGGFKTETSLLKFHNSPRKVNFEWESEGVLYDRDGSLTGNVGYSVAACTNSFDPSKCIPAPEMSLDKLGCICNDKIKLVRFSFNKISPSSLNYKDAIFTSEFGTSFSPWAKKRITHKKGWSMVLMANQYYNFSFENAEHISNTSYDSAFYNFGSADFVAFRQSAEDKPDLFMLNGIDAINMSDSMLSGDNVRYGHWFYSVPDRKIIYAVSHKARKKRFISLSSSDFTIKMRAIRCQNRGCKPPEKPMNIVRPPSHLEYWSDAATWTGSTIDNQEPKAGDDLLIPLDKWIVVDKSIPPLGNVIIKGGLEFQTNSSLKILLEANYIYITGRLIMGWSEAEPFEGQAIIRLRGNHSTPAYPDGPSLGAKFIAVFGGLQLHGVDRGITKTYLSSTVLPGSNLITVTDTVSWTDNDEILISTTDYNAWHTEVFKIIDISGNTITLNDTIKHRHIAHTENVNGQLIHLRASVALLTRNIRIEGEEYPNMEKESFGARIIVGQTFDDGQHSGFAQLSNVELYHTGQEGFTDDARFSLTYLDVTSSPDNVRYSYVKKCAFHNGFNTAIGVFGIESLEIYDNTVHHTLGPGIRTEAIKTKIVNNLVILSIWPGAYQDRFEQFNVLFEGAIHATEASELILINNTVAGSERVGYRLRGQACSTGAEDLWFNNVAHSCLEGTLLFSEDSPADPDCTLFNGFILWKNLDFGIYYQSKASCELRNNILAENGVGVFPFIYGPPALSHAFEEKTAKIENNIIIAKTSSFSEVEDKIDDQDANIKLSSHARSAGANAACGKIGIVMANFLSGPNLAPEKPFNGIKTYPAIKGLTRVHDCTFVNFGSCTGGQDHVLSTNKENDDLIHPLQISGSSLVNVDSKAKVNFDPPNVGKVNPTDCVDMDCDGLKKCMIRDLDGSFLGAPGTVLPNSAYEWDGDPRHGVGDYRIPSVMLTTSNGIKIDVDSYAPHKGIFKTDNCTWIPEWKAFHCGNNYHWRMLSFESMDKDTEKRRLSPVAVFHPAGYIDLINGPQDHGWCVGYTCQKRISTFYALVALDEPFEIFLTSTNPKSMRFMLLNSGSSECVRLGMWYITRNRVELEVDGNLHLPKNGFIDSNGGFRLRLQNTNHQYMPEVKDKINGEYYYSRGEQMVFWTQCGESKITVNMKDVFIVSFTLPAMTEEEFFGEKLVENLAAFLGMDPNKVRIVDIVEDTSSSNRRKRQIGTVVFVVEIADNPGEPDTIDYETVGQQLINQFQTQENGMNDIINATVLYMGIIEPNSTSSQTVTLQQPGHLVMDTHPIGNTEENEALKVQPKFKVTDSNGDVVTYLGSVTSSWEIEASIKSSDNPLATLIGNTSITFIDGWANFTDLSFTYKGSYILQFQVVAPPEATNYSVDSLEVKVIGRNIEPKANLITTNRLTGIPLELEVSLINKDTNLDITDLEWANLNWTATAEIYDSQIYSGSLSGTTTVDFDPDSGTALFNDLQLSSPGISPVLVTITSNPSDYEVKMVVFIDVMTAAQKNMIVTENRTLEMKFPIAYDEDRAPYWTAQVVSYYSSNEEMRIVGYRYKSGSLIVILDIEATTAGYNGTLQTLCTDIENSTTFTFDNITVAMSGYLTVDGEPYYGVSCGKIDSSDSDGLDTVYIVIIVLAVIILILICVLLVYIFYFRPQSKKSNANNVQAKGYYARSDYLSDALDREDTMSSLKSRPYSPVTPPLATQLPTGKSFDLSIKSPPPGSPLNTHNRVSPQPLSRESTETRRAWRL